MRNPGWTVTLVPCFLSLTAMVGCEGFGRNINPYAGYGSPRLSAPATGSYTIPGRTGSGSYYGSNVDPAPADGALVSTSGATVQPSQQAVADTNTTGWVRTQPPATFDRNVMPVQYVDTGSGLPVAGGSGTTRVLSTSNSTDSTFAPRDSQPLRVNDASHLRAPERFVAPANAALLNAGAGSNGTNGLSANGTVPFAAGTASPMFPMQTMTPRPGGNPAGNVTVEVVTSAPPSIMSPTSSAGTPSALANHQSVSNSGWTSRHTSR